MPARASADRARCARSRALAAALGERRDRDVQLRAARAAARRVRRAPSGTPSSCSRDELRDEQQQANVELAQGARPRQAQPAAPPTGEARAMKAQADRRARTGDAAGGGRAADRRGAHRRAVRVRAGGARRARGHARCTTCESRQSGCATCSSWSASASARSARRRRARARELQEVLGEIHDCDVMLERIAASRAATNRTGFDALAVALPRRAAPRQFARFNALWETIEASGLRDRLLATRSRHQPTTPWAHNPRLTMSAT